MRNADQDSQATTPWSVRFRREREASWTQLEDLVVKCERRGLKRLSAAELARLPILYRATLSSLSVARVNILDRGLLNYLESLTARAYLWVYAPRRGVLRTAGNYFGSAFPRAVRSLGPHLIVSVGVLMLGGCIAAALFYANPDTYSYFVGEGMAQGRDPSATTAELRDVLFSTDEEANENLTTFTAYLFTHNSSVAILTFGLGFLFGIPVLLLLLYNGMVLGAMSALYHSRGLGVEWWSWILPHGITEMFAICLAGAAALAVSHRLIFAGRSSRVVELSLVGRTMAGVIAGAVGMLFIAAMTEGIFRQTVLDVSIRYALAAILPLCWLLYFTQAGRVGTPRADP